jgi:Beta-lactamase enzyme family
VPIASVFKLWVLDALARSIASGSTSWDDSIAIRNDLRSDPSGQVFHYPEGQSVSVERMAELMISISDNTAADHLIGLLGRGAVEAVIRELAPDGADRTVPFLSTADMGRLKFAHPGLGREYLTLDPIHRRDFLSKLPARGPLPSDASTLAELDLETPSFVDEIEWFASAADLCRTVADLAKLSRKPGLEAVGTILSINSGMPPAQAAFWESVWFKGGSEPGVVALVYRLTRKEVDRVVVVTLSDPKEPLTQHPDGERVIASILDRANS